VPAVARQNYINCKSINIYLIENSILELPGVINKSPNLIGKLFLMLQLWVFGLLFL
jgi:hypothetical protein